MAKGAKLLFIVLLAALSLGCLFLVMQMSFKDEIIRQLSDKEKELTQQAEHLSSQVSTAQSEKRRLEERLDSTKRDIDAISSDRDNWKGKHETVLREKDELVQKIQSIPSQMERPSVSAPPSDEGYWAEVLKDKAALELRINDLKSQLSETSIQIEEAKKSKAEVDIDIAKLKQSNEDLEKKIKYSAELSNSLALDLAREKNSKKGIAEQVGKLKEDNMNLRYQIKELTSSKVSLERGLQKLITEKDKLSKRMAETEQVVQGRIDEVLGIKKELEARFKAGQSAAAPEAKPIELPPIVVRSGDSSAKEVKRSADFKGKVVTVNEANNFVIIDLGESVGVKIGDDFKVYRDNKQIATVEVIQARKDISAADIKQKSQKIQVGDLVK